MNQPTFIVWSVLAFIGGIAFIFAAKYYKRKLKKWAAWQKVGLMVIAALSGWLTFYFNGDRQILNWFLRLLFILLGGLSVWVTYKQSWPLRNQETYTEDSFFVEYLYAQFSAFIATAFFFLPALLRGMIPDESIGLVNQFWDLPLLFLLPFLVMKLYDFALQRPLRYVENQWSYPLEALDTSKVTWQNFTQVNFRVKRSLEDEYRLFTRSAKPWIEAPKELTLADAFRMTMQERAKRTDLSSIQDLGDTYVGTERFWWLFTLRPDWWNPISWFQKKRHLNPDQKIGRMELGKGATIVARRIPYGAAYVAENFASPEDLDKTVIIRR